MGIKFVEVFCDNGYRYGQSENPSYCTDSTDKLTSRGARHNVAIADGAHGDDGPPKGLGNAGEGCVRLVFLSKITQTREYENSHGKEEHKQTKLLVGILEGEAQ